MAYLSEQQLENEMIRQLSQLDYEKVSIPSVEQLVTTKFPQSNQPSK